MKHKQLKCLVAGPCDQQLDHFFKSGTYELNGVRCKFCNEDLEKLEAQLDATVEQVNGIFLH